jgi:cytochrome P450
MARALDPETLLCPQGYFAELHAAGTRAFDEGVVGIVVPGYEDLMSISRAPELFSSCFHGDSGPDLMGVGPEPYDEEVTALVAQCQDLSNVMLLADPPVHTRQRAIATKALNATRVRRMEPIIQSTVDELIDGFIEDGHVDIVAGLGAPLPLKMIATTLGVRDMDQPRFSKWAGDIVAGHVEVLDNARRKVVARSLIEFGDYMLARIDERRQEPRDDLLSALIHTRLDAEELADVDGDGGTRLNTRELLTIAAQLLAAGNHSSTAMLASGVKQLASDPALADELRADPTLVPAFVEETLRISGPVQSTYRRPTKDTDLGGCPIPKDAMVCMVWGAAGHDPNVFPDPRRFDIHRPNLRKHLSFGHGPHFCVGSGLARAEGRIAFETILRRMDDLRLLEAVPAAGFGFRGHESVEVTFTARDR